MSASEDQASAVQDYLRGLGAEERAALERVVSVAREVVPEAEEGRSYGMPALRHHGKPLIGFVAAKQHLSVFPFSPAVIDAVAERLDGFELSKGTIRFTVERPLPEDVLREVVSLRQEEIEGR